MKMRFRTLNLGFAANQGNGCGHREVVLSLVHRLVRCLFGLLTVLVRADLSKAIELLALRHAFGSASQQYAG
ncbi:hypothetical protein [Nonomuraea sp. NPDC049709]|uniref:hypothetical protein n=1 Tax=Nonomuraea sp. NPDC049709 TaxID=3154736 RepID=UPI00343732B2